MTNKETWQDIIDPINKQIIKYYEKVQVETPNPLSLMSIQERISALSWSLAKFVAETREDRNNSKFRYDKLIVERESYYLSTGLKSLQAKTASKSDALKLSEELNTAENLYKTSKILLEQINRILSTLMQRISMLRKEAENNHYQLNK